MKHSRFVKQMVRQLVHLAGSLSTVTLLAEHTVDADVLDAFHVVPCCRTRELGTHYTSPILKLFCLRLARQDGPYALRTLANC